MAYMERHRVALTTNASGDVTAYTPHVTGRIRTLIYTKDNFDAGVDFVITAENTGEIIWDEDSVDAAKTIAPRQSTHSTDGAAAVYDGVGSKPVLNHICLANDRVKIVIANGGATKSGSIDVVVG